MRRSTTLILFLATVVGGGLAIGFLTAPGYWYAGLTKPSFSPPKWVFAPVWTLLYVLIAIAGWRTLEDDCAGRRMIAWGAQLALNFLWSPVFFAAHRIDLALLVIVLLLAALLAFIKMSWRRDRITAITFVPYAAWVGFACVLNASIFVLN